jgi:hypothetical protein
LTPSPFTLNPDSDTSERYLAANDVGFPSVSDALLVANIVRKAVAAPE